MSFRRFMVLVFCVASLTACGGQTQPTRDLPTLAPLSTSVTAIAPNSTNCNRRELGRWLERASTTSSQFLSIVNASLVNQPQQMLNTVNEILGLRSFLASFPYPECARGHAESIFNLMDITINGLETYAQGGSVDLAALVTGINNQYADLRQQERTLDEVYQLLPAE
jgi:hypothetical protein